jgi:hypothetical protein
MKSLLVKRAWIFSRVKLPSSAWKLVIKIEREGKKRKRKAKRKKGTTPIHAQENLVFWDRANSLETGSLPVITLTLYNS